MSPPSEVGEGRPSGPANVERAVPQPPITSGIPARIKTSRRLDAKPAGRHGKPEP